MIVGIILIIVAFVTFILDVLWGDEPEASTRGFTLGMATMVGAFIVCEKLPQKKRELRYPTTEYTLEYKLITRGEQVDSVYVICESQLDSCGHGKDRMGE